MEHDESREFPLSIQPLKFFYVFYPLLLSRWYCFITHYLGISYLLKEKNGYKPPFSPIMKTIENNIKLK